VWWPAGGQLWAKRSKEKQRRAKGSKEEAESGPLRRRKCGSKIAVKVELRLESGRIGAL